jgi:RNA ligase
MTDFVEFPKIARLSRLCVITEKLDGTNASITITENGEFLCGSRTRWITPDDDNYGFARWAHENKKALMELGPGSHFGEWWGQGIQRKYGIDEKRFSLFNTSRWCDERPECCHVVPVLFQGIFSSLQVDAALEQLSATGSCAAPGFMKPEGVIVYHVAANLYFKKTLERDDEWKGKK